MTVLGYARVSTRDRHLSARLEALKATGAAKIYREKISSVRLPSFNYIIGASEQRWRHGEAERLGGLEVDD